MSDRSLDQLKVAELREELRKRGLGQKGVKKELVERLEEAVRKEGQIDTVHLNVVADEKLSDSGYGSFHNVEKVAESDDDDDEKRLEDNQPSQSPTGNDVNACIAFEVSDSRDVPYQEEEKNDLPQEPDRNGASGLPEHSVADCLEEQTGFNTVAMTGNQALSSSASVTKGDLEAEPCMASLEPDRAYQEMDDTEMIADDYDNESTVKEAKIAELRSEETPPRQPAANLESVIQGVELVLPESYGSQHAENEIASRNEDTAMENDSLLNEEYEGIKYSFQSEKPADESLKMLEENNTDGKKVETRCLSEALEVTSSGCKEEESVNHSFGDRKPGHGYLKAGERNETSGEKLDIKSPTKALKLNEDLKDVRSKAMEIDSQLYSSQKRKEEEDETRQHEPTKRQRRWNSGNKLTVEAAKPLTIDTAKEIFLSDGKGEPHSSSKTTPKVVAASRPASVSVRMEPSNSSREKQRLVPPSLRRPTTSLRVDRFLRPFTLKAVKELLSQTGTFVHFWMDQIKTHCYVTYSSVEEAVATRNALYDLQWPASFGNTLTADFVDPEEVKVRCESQSEKPLSSPTPTTRPGAFAPPLPVAAPSVALPSSMPSPLPPPPVRERPLPLPKEPEPTLDDLFKKTKAKPQIYYLPLTDEEVAAKLAKKREVQSQNPSVRA